VESAALASRTAIGVLLGQIDKVLLAEAAIRLGTRRLRLGQSYRDAGLVAGEDLGVAEVAAIGYSVVPFSRCPLPSESDQSAALQRNDAKGQKLTSLRTIKAAH
jgi:hypothetical protein